MATQQTLLFAVNSALVPLHLSDIRTTFSIPSAPTTELKLLFFYDMSLVVRKPAFCICEKKDADQLRGNREADQRLCFRYSDSTIHLLPKSEISSLLSSSMAVPVCVGPGRKPRRPVFSQRGSLRLNLPYCLQLIPLWSLTLSGIRTTFPDFLQIPQNFNYSFFYIVLTYTIPQTKAGQDYYILSLRSYWSYIYVNVGH